LDQETQYGSSIDALDDLLTTSHVTNISASLSHLTNGMEYSFVEVTCSDGSQYGLQAYGNEALDLNRMALENVPKSQLTPMVVSQ
jgi:hypothetical protein